MTEKIKPKGIIIFSALLTAGTLYRLIGLFDFSYYQFMFQQLPYGLIVFRYIVSILGKAVGLTVGFGLLTLREPLRKLALIFCWFHFVSALIL